MSKLTTELFNKDTPVFPTYLSVGMPSFNVPAELTAAWSDPVASAANIVPLEDTGRQQVLNSDPIKITSAASTDIVALTVPGTYEGFIEMEFINDNSPSVSAQIAFAIVDNVGTPSTTTVFKEADFMGVSDEILAPESSDHPRRKYARTFMMSVADPTDLRVMAACRVSGITGLRLIRGFLSLKRVADYSVVTTTA